MKKTINIPNVTWETRIGSVFNYLYRIISDTSSHDDDVVWDFSNVEYLHPFFIAPLSICRKELDSKKNITCINMNYALSSYFGQIKFFNTLSVTDRDKLQTALASYQSKSYLPVCQFELANEDLDMMQTIMQRTIEKQKSMDWQLKSAISYLLGELICNMQQHSRSNYGYLYTQYHSRDNSLYICLADTGITIYGCYVDSKKYDEMLTEQESSALRLAVEGKSTKDKEGSVARGFGISTNINMIVNGLGGGFFIMSGGSFYRMENGKEVYVDLPEPIYWNGTIVLVRIPVVAPNDFDYYKYMEE